jgi:hypothetical protein
MHEMPYFVDSNAPSGTRRKHPKTPQNVPSRCRRHPVKVATCSLACIEVLADRSHRRHGILSEALVMPWVSTVAGEILTSAPPTVGQETLREGVLAVRVGRAVLAHGHARRAQPRAFNSPTGPAKQLARVAWTRACAGRCGYLAFVARRRVSYPTGNAGLYHYDRLDRREVSSECSDPGLLPTCTGRATRHGYGLYNGPRPRHLQAFPSSETLATGQKRPRHAGAGVGRLVGDPEDPTGSPMPPAGRPLRLSLDQLIGQRCQVLGEMMVPVLTAAYPLIRHPPLVAFWQGRLEFSLVAGIWLNLVDSVVC